MKYVSSSDGIVYRDVHTLSGQSLEVLKADDAGLRQLFTLINKSLDAIYQPITLQYDEGVLVCSELGEFFLKDIRLDNVRKNVVVTVFGDESVYTFPLERKRVAVVDNGKACKYPECSADHTSLFSMEVIPLGKYQIYTVAEKGVHFVHCDELGLNIQGDLLGYTDDFICTSTENVTRVWSTDSDFNTAVRMLPAAVNMLLSCDGCIYLSGYLNAPSQTYKVLSLKKIDSESVDVQVSSIDNEFLPFYLTFCNDSVDGWTVLLNGLSASRYKSKQVFRRKT